MVEAATNAQIKEIFERNERTVRSDRRKKTVGKAELWVTELDALLERIRTAEADKARLSEALRRIEGLDSHIDATPRGDRKVIGGEFAQIARAALSGSGSSWRLVPYLWQCKNYADGWLSFANEDEAQAYQRDTGCAVRITYRPLPAAPQQGGE